MPTVVKLISKSTKETMDYQTLDRLICAHLGRKVESSVWCHDWYNHIGLGLAVGWKWPKIRENYADDPIMLKIIDYLETNYTVNSWWEPKYAY